MPSMRQFRLKLGRGKIDVGHAEMSETMAIPALLS